MLPTDAAPNTGFGTPGISPTRFRDRMPGEFAQPPQVAPTQPTTGKGGQQTILKEQLLRVTLEVEFVKLLPKS
jgi:hypothetical protein